MGWEMTTRGLSIQGEWPGLFVIFHRSTCLNPSIHIYYNSSYRLAPPHLDAHPLSLPHIPANPLPKGEC